MRTNDRLTLWIAFSSLILLRIHSKEENNKSVVNVVNCFQFFNFIEDSQFQFSIRMVQGGCELLSVL